MKKIAILVVLIVVGIVIARAVSGREGS